MTPGIDKIDTMPVVRELKDFEKHSGNHLERLIFNNRIAIVLLCLVATLLLGFQATGLVLNASFEKMMPQSHPYIMNYLENKNDLRSLGNTLRVVVENTQGDIFDARYLETLKQISDELFLMPGVDRAWMKSLWTPVVRWTEVTEEGFRGGPVMPESYDGTTKSVESLRLNIARAGIVGSLVANNFKSTMIVVPLLDNEPGTSKPLDYRRFSRQIEDSIRIKYETLNSQNVKSGVKESSAIRIHIIGFAKLVGELIEGMTQVAAYFGIAIGITAGAILIYTRCIRSTLLVLICSLVAVVWQLGLVAALGYEFDPYSMLVPFLIFAIGVSHGAQKMNGIMQDVGRGTHKLIGARYTFRRLFVAGLTALLADVVGFAVLMFIDIPVIKDLAITASIGVAVLIFTNLVLLPVLLSYTGVSPAAALRSVREESAESRGKGLGKLWIFLDCFTQRNWAIGAIAVSIALAIWGIAVSTDLKIGDLDPGAPELRADSTYNLDNSYITSNYRLSSDQFAVIVKTPPDGCVKRETLVEADRLAWELQQLPGVQTTVSLPDTLRQITAASYEGSPKWYSISRNQAVVNYSAQQASVVNRELFNSECSVFPVIAYLADHKASTLEEVVAVAAEFSKKHSEADRLFLLAAGSAGIEAATNIVVEKANRTMLISVYAAVILLCLVTFRSWRAVIVAVVPLVVTTILAEALMVKLGIGVKVATLPVTALGVGIGVDYSLYLVSVQLEALRTGSTLADAYRRAVQFTGKVVMLVGITLATSVVTWVWSPIKFQADMGILLTFMFVWNMISALVLIPSLSHFLLTRRE